MVEIFCIAAIIPIEIRRYQKDYEVKKASWLDLFLGCSIETGQDDINMMDPGRQIVFPKLLEPAIGISTPHLVQLHEELKVPSKS